MTIHLQPIATAVFLGVMLCWLIFVGGLLFGKKPPEAPTSKRARISRLGIALQGMGYAIVWILRREWFTPIVPMPKVAEIVLAVFTVGVGASSVWLMMSAARTLGKQWSFQARLVEEHNLVTEGPYAFVRNPIYAGMLGMLVAMGLAVSHWLGLAGGLAVFGVGTAIRIRSEEKLLREAFGSAFEAYAQRVPALFPRVR